jgi:SAM-dependent methyltransferase
MSNPATNATFRVFVSRYTENIGNILCIYDDVGTDDALAFKRMVSAFTIAPLVQMVRFEVFDQALLSPSAYVVQFLEVDIIINTGYNKTISTDTISDEDKYSAFYKEVQAHDFELGGVIEWNEEFEAQFSRYVLQSLSLAHVKRSFPFDLWHSLPQDWRKPLRCLDVGCGPISKLRYGALKGWLHIVGVDPLNDMYSAILARHGLTQIEKIRPDDIISGFAEDVEFSDNPFDLIYSLNALDHTQDLVRSLKHIGDNLSPGGVAYIQVYEKEGERQNYSGLHKFNIWIQDDIVMYNEKDTKPENLIAQIPLLHMDRIYITDQDECAFSVRRYT